MKVAFFDTKPYDQKIFQKHNNNPNIDITFFEARLTEKSVLLAKGFDVVCIFVRDEITSKVIDCLEEFGIKMIALRCAGYNNVDFKAAFGKIKVVHVPAYSPYAVAEFTVSMMLTLNRKIHKSYGRTRDMNFSLNSLLGFDMNGKTVGVVGTGKIAKILIKILKGFGCNILTFDIYEDKQASIELGFTYTSLDNLFSKSDIISLHVPLTKDTEYIINKKSIQKMKDNVMIINTGRGKLINTVDMIDALKKKKIGAAGLDVYEEEDRYFYEDYSERVITDDVLARLLSFPNVLITSHQAFFTNEALTNIAKTTLESMESLMKNKPLVNEIAYICDENGCAIKTPN
ncbi:MAG: 2-hydroxyacid dehydrogenase [Eubacteriales bacterium]